jgi:hypothetical protein
MRLSLPAKTAWTAGIDLSLCNKRRINPNSIEMADQYKCDREKDHDGVHVDNKHKVIWDNEVE